MLGGWLFSTYVIPAGVTKIGDSVFSGCSGLSGITIPEGVTSIGDSAFSGCSSLSGITIPEGVTSIGDSAFSGCSGLSGITIPEGVTSIGDSAFSGCSGLSGITIPEGVTSIGESAFRGCSALSGITIPESVTSIGDYAFNGCEDLTSIAIPAGVTKIGEGVFKECSGLAGITIPRSVTQIGVRAFSGCSNLTDVHYQGSFEEWNEISRASDNTILSDAAIYCMGNDGKVHVYRKGGKCGVNLTWTMVDGTLTVSGQGKMPGYLENSAPWTSYRDEITTVVLSQGVSSVGAYAFGWCKNLVSISIPQSVMVIGSNAFADCTGLTDVYYTGTQAQWESIAIGKDNDALTHATIHHSLVKGTCGENLTWMLDESGTLIISGTGAMTDYNRDGYMVSGDSPFVNMDIKKLVLNEGITHIGDCAFISCTGDWGTVVLPESLESIGEEAFHRCTALTGTLVIPKNVQRIGGSHIYPASAFGGNRLTSISVAEGNPWFTARDGILYTKDLSRLIACPGQKNGAITFPETLKTIDPSAFFGCSGLTGDLIFPEGLQCIGAWAFTGCSGFDGSISLPESLAYIQQGAFGGCSGLTGTLILPHGVFVGKGAFSGCTGLTEVHFPGDVVFQGDYIFENCPIKNFYFDGTQKQWLQLQKQKDDYGYIGPLFAAVYPNNVFGTDFAFGGFELVEWFCEDGKLEIMGHTEDEDGNSGVTNIIPDYSPKNLAPWARYSFRELVITGNIARIGSYAFQGHNELTCVQINNNLTSVGINAFDGCSGLQKGKYYGSPEERDAIVMESGNSWLRNASWEDWFMPVWAEPLYENWNWQDGISSGQSVQFTAAMMPENKVLDPEWWLPEEYRPYATLSSDGVLTAKTVSKAVLVTLWAIEDSYGMGGTDIWIRPRSTGLAIDQGGALTVDMYRSPTVQLTATVAPADANQAVSWSSSDEKVATVNATGEVTLQKPGTVIITAKTMDGTNRTANIKLTVYYLDTAKSLKVSSDAPAVGLQPGQTAQLTVTGNDVLPVEKLLFSVPENQQQIATVDDYGVVTAGDTPGTATVTVTVQGDELNRKATCKITVIDYMVTSVVLFPYGDDISLGDHYGQWMVILDAQDVKQDATTFLVSAMGCNYLGSLVDTSVTWASSNTAIATLKDNKDGTAVVTIKKGASGECAITATAKDKLKASAQLCISVRDYQPRLESTSLTMNLCKSPQVEVELQGSYGYTVTDVSLDDRFDATWKNGILTVTAREGTGKGTYTQTLQVTSGNGVLTRTDTYTLKIKVTDTAPAITTKQSGKYNLFYTDGTAALTITAREAAVADVKVAGGDFTGEFRDGVLTLNAKGGSVPGKKVELEIALAGYAKTIRKTVTLSTVNTAPKLKLTATSSSINTNYGNQFTTFQVLKDGEVLPLNRSDIVYSGIFAEFDVYADAITLTLSGTKGGTATLNIRKDNWAKPVKLTHKVAVQTTLPTMKLGTTTLKLNSVFPAVGAETTLSLSQANVYLADEDVVLTSGNAGAEKLSVTFRDGKIVAKITDASVKAGTYTYSCKAMLNGKTALKAVTVKVNVSAAEPKVKLAATTFKLNRNLAGKETISTKVTVPAGYTLKGFQIDNPGGNFTFEAGYLTVALDARGAGGSYTLYPILKPEGSDVAVTMKTGIKVKLTPYSGDVTATVATKGRLDTQNPDSIITGTVKLKNCAGVISAVSLSGEDSNLFNAEVQDGKVLISMVEGKTYATNKNYKLTLDMEACGVTVSKAISFKVSQTALKVAVAPTAVTCFQALNRISAKLTVTSPITAEIAQVTLSNKTAVALRDACGEKGSLNFDQNTGKFTLTLENPAMLTPGKNYTLILDVTPKGNAANVNPIQVRLTVKVQK